MFVLFVWECVLGFGLLGFLFVFCGCFWLGEGLFCLGCGLFGFNDEDGGGLCLCVVFIVVWLVIVLGMLGCLVSVWL